jgi:large repetitive protein
MVVAMLIGLIPAAPVRAEESSNTSVAHSASEEAAQKMDQQQQLVGEIVATDPLSWTVMNKIDRGFLASIYPEDIPRIRLSKDERYVATVRLRMDLDNPLDSKEVITIYDRVTGESFDIAGPSTYTNGKMLDFDMSDDSHYIVFSYSENLMNPVSKVYLHDRTTGTQVEITPEGGYGGYGYDDEVNRVSISSDGRFIAFDSEANGLVAGDNDDYRDVFLYDRDATGQKITRISTLPELGEEDENESSAPSISDDGRYIAFQSRKNLTNEKNNNYMQDIFIYDRESTTEPFRKIPFGLNGVEVDGESYLPSISANGQAVAFLSDASNIVENDTNYQPDLFVWQANNGDATIKRVATVPDPADPSDLYQIRIEKPLISPDGQYVGYERHDDTAMEETIIEAFVADVRTQTSTAVSVPTSPFTLLNEKTLPVVGENAKTVIFFAEYEKVIDGYGSFALPGIFIAANGSAPYWGPGSTLTATQQNGTITLSWPDAMDTTNILGYQIHQDDSVIGYVPSGAGNTFTTTEIEAGQFPIFQVEAVNSQYNVSYGGPVYKLGGDQPAPAPSLTVNWNADRSKNGLPLMGSKLSIKAFTGTGLQVQGTLTYKMAGEIEPRSENVVLTEQSTQPGSYFTNFILKDGLVELTSLTIKATDPVTKVEVVKSVTNWPIKINGNITIQFDNPGRANLAGAYLAIRNNKYGGNFINLDGQDPVTVEGLHPDESYTVILYSANKMRILAQEEGIQVGSGLESTKTLLVDAPANIRFKINGPDGKPVEYIGVQLFKGDDPANQEFLGTFTSHHDGWTDFYENLKAGEKVTAKIDIGDHMYQKVPDQVIELVIGDNERMIQLIELPAGILEGHVKNDKGEPVLNARVTMQQSIAGKEIVKHTYTGLDGYYKFDPLYAGEVSVEASESSYYYQTESSLKAQIEDGKTTTLPITVKQPSTGVINLKVYLKYIDSDWIGPVDMEQQAMYTKVESKHRYHSGYFHNAYHFQGYPGEEVSVCVTATVPSYTSQCANVILDENANATAELRFAEIGGRIKGTFAQTNHHFVYGTIYKVEGNTPTFAKALTTNDFRGNSYNINIMEPGKYRMQLVRTVVSDKLKYEYATVDFTVHDQQITEMAPIHFSPSSYFANMHGNVFSAVTTQVFPGSTATFRLSYQNVKDKEVKDTSLIVNVPDGMTPVTDHTGKIIINGVNTTAVVEGKNLVIPLGDLAAKQAGTLSYQLKVAPDFNGFNVTTSARIQTTLDGAQVEETIGTILLDTPQVSLEIPKHLTSLTTEITGRAPAGRTVKVYDTKVLIGSAVSSATGYWKLNATLPDLGNPSTHALHAETVSSSVNLRSETVYSDYDSASPKLVDVTMAQAPDGKWVKIEPEKGISRLPYTVIPGNPFKFELKFDRPDDVENVSVYIGGQEGSSVKAVRDGDIYKAVTPTGQAALGAIYVSYDSKPIPFTYDSRQPTMEEIRQSMPADMRDFEIVETTPFELRNGKYSGQVKIKFPKLGDMIMTVKLNIEPNADYQPTPTEIAMAEKSGTPVVNSTVSESETEESLTTTMSGYIPMDILFPGGLPASNSHSKKQTSGTIATGESGWKAVGHFTYESSMEFTEVAKTGNDIRKSYNDMNEFAQRINKIMYNVQSGFDCLAEIPTTVKEAGIALAATVGGEVAKVGLGAWTAAMGVTGPGGIAMAVGVQLAEKKIDAWVDSKIDAISSGYNECKKDDKKRKIADPKWIYDPSGYVYEAVPENRLEGVKATVLYLDPVSGSWEVWDAEPYEQVNPQLTNKEGKYGWDVPPGKWKVVWEKDGYESISSAELDVPPPHTEVNAGLVSRVAPLVETVTGVVKAETSYVDVTFTKYLQVADLPADALEVVGPDGKSVAGTVTLVEKKADPVRAGKELSNKVRLEIASRLVVGGTYQIKVNPSYFQSYADSWMKAEYIGLFAVVAEDVTGPSAVTAEVNGRLLAVQFDEPIGTVTTDMEKFLVGGEVDSVLSAVTDVDDDKLLYLTLAEPLSGHQTVEVTVLAGAILDVKGNASIEKKLMVATETGYSTNALLGALAIDGTALTPAFDSNQMAYTAAVANSATHVTITASVADAKAKLLIAENETASGVAKSVLIPKNGEIIVRVLAEDGVTSKSYTIKVERQAANANAWLAALFVDGATLVPAFDPNKVAYKVEVETGATQVSINAQVASAKAKLFIGGTEAISGVAKFVLIPTNGEIAVRVVAEDGVTEKIYTIKVERKPASNPNPNPNPGPVDPTPVGHPLDLGKHAAMETKKEADGTTTVVISIKKETVADALKILKEKDVLFIEVKEQATQYNLQLSNEIVEMLVTAKAGIQFKNDIIDVMIPALALVVSGSEVGGVNVQVSKASEPMKKQLTETAKAQSGGALVPAGHMISLGINNGKTTIVANWAAKLEKGEALYRYDLAKKKWNFVGTEGSLQIKANEGVYAVMTYVSNYQDLTKNWAKTDIEWMEQRLYLEGLGEGQFKPNQAITRAEFTSMLVKALGLKADLEETTRFKDVSEDSWYYDEVLTAAALGIVKGKPDGTFAPNDSITREQMAIMIWRAYEKLGLASGNVKGDLAILEKFTDRGRISSGAAEAVAAAVREGLLNGKGSLLDPKGLTTRAQAVVVIRRILGKM